MVDGAIAVEDEQLGAQNSSDPALNTAAGAQYSFVESEAEEEKEANEKNTCLLYTSPSPLDRTRSRLPSSA